MFLKKAAMIGGGILLLLLLPGLCGCGAQTEMETEPPTVTVRYLVAGEEFTSQELAQGQRPDAVEPPDVPGMVFSGWMNGTGDRIVPEAVQIRLDTAYTARFYPELSNHVPYLFTDRSGFFRPDDILTENELAMALQMLATEDARPYLTEMPSGQAQETTAMLKAVLEAYFPEEAVADALSEWEEGPVARRDFARAMNRLLGRQGETVIAPEIIMPPDLHTGMDDLADILEACVPHVRDGGGVAWEEIPAVMEWTPGFFNLGGYLYYADETGHIVRDAQVGALSFGPDGRYTSGDAELDGLVAERLFAIIREDLYADRQTLLQKAYLYCRDQFTYLRRDNIAFGATGWEAERAKAMLSTGCGNCYNYAGAFWALARGLGFEAQGVSGQVLELHQPHAWVMITMDDVAYFFDPELEMSFRYERGEPKTDLYMRTAYQVRYYEYIF